jgi:DNA-directed RNA polymerase specialized sigma24 family protein
MSCGQLHRYCARLMGSVIEGEDVVQDTFVRAFGRAGGDGASAAVAGFSARQERRAAMASPP